MFAWFTAYMVLGLARSISVAVLKNRDISDRGIFWTLALIQTRLVIVSFRVIGQRLELILGTRSRTRALAYYKDADIDDVTICAYKEVLSGTGRGIVERIWVANALLESRTSNSQ